MALDIILASQFRNKGFKQADTAINKLSGSAKKLAGTLGLAFGTAAILGYAKASVKAAAADIKAQKQLALTLNNLGMARDAAGAEKYIQSIEKEFAVVDDLLRPAYAQLVRSTRNAAKAQKILNVALDISASTGKKLDIVTMGLNKAYGGNLASLGRLGIGLSKADLKTKSFDEILNQLANTFDGAAKEAADSYAGSLDKLAIASNNVKEIIGVGIIDSLKILGDNKSIDGVVSDMELLAKTTADVIRGVAKAVELFGKLPKSVKFLLSPIAATRTAFSELEANRRRALGENMTKRGLSKGGAGMRGLGAVPKVEKDRLVVSKAQTAAQKAAAILAKKDADLSKAAAVFDLTKISIAAALKGKIDDETRLRLLAMQAIENDKGALALKHLKDLATLQAGNDLAKLAGMKTISDATLAGLTQNLLNEIEAINKTNQLQKYKAESIEKAFERYNLAIKAAGGLSDAALYSEKTQILQNTLLKIAAANLGPNAAITANNLLESAQDASIKRVAGAQAIADKARMDAILAYIAVLNSISRFGEGDSKSGRGTGTTPSDLMSGGGLDYKWDIANDAASRTAPSIVLNLSTGFVAQPEELVKLVQDALLTAANRGYAINPIGGL